MKPDTKCPIPGCKAPKFERGSDEVYDHWRCGRRAHMDGITPPDRPCGIAEKLLLEALARLDKIAELLRYEDGGPESEIRTCECCGYTGHFDTIGCACYDEWAYGCTPEHPGPGCFNGFPLCPVCQNGEDSPDTQQVAQALMLAEGSQDAQET
jgi:hypothetical protein